jgi:heptosyltransferase-2
MDSRRWQNVLVLQTSFLGDTVLTLPLLSEIKSRTPAAKLTVLCSPIGKELLQGHPAIDEIIVDDTRGADRGLAGMWRKAMRLRQMAFSVALTPHKSLRSALLLYLAGIPIRVGFRQSKGWFLFHVRVDRNAGRHDVERNLSLLQPFNIEPKDCRLSFELPVRAAAKSAGREFLRSLGVDPDGLLIGVHPGSVWPTKRWSASGFARVIEAIKKKHDCQVLLFGAAEDRAIVSQVYDLCGGAALDLAGKITVRDLPDALGLCRLFLTNDSGPMHIAVARNVPTVAIFCATTPALGFYPYSGSSIVIEKDLPCRPCGTHGGLRCPLGTEDCIRLISPEHVAGAVEKLLSRPVERLALTPCGTMPDFVRV